MKSYEASADIAATAPEIWAILTDAPRLSRWDSGVDSVEGTIAAGETITVHAHVNPKRAFPVAVTEFEPSRRMVWSGGMPLGLFRGVRTYSLEPLGNGSTRFAMREEYSGPLLPLIWRSMPDLAPSFAQFAAGLKREAEAAAAAAAR